MKKYFNFNFWKNFIFGSQTRKLLTTNFLSLITLQAINFLLPLITLPYLVRILGPEKYGLIAFAQSMVLYFNILADYGFNFSATREVSINRDDKNKINNIFSSVMSVKFCLGILGFALLVLLVFIFPRFKKDWLIYLLTYGMVFGNIFFPTWLFLGLEKIKYVTIVNIISKGISTICIFIFINNVSDYIYVPLINSLGFLIAGALSLGSAFRNFKVKFSLPSLNNMKHQLIEGRHVFISQIAVSGYSNSRIFAVGLFTNSTITGYYSIAEKLVNLVQAFPVSSLVQVLYPRLSKIFSENKRYAMKIMNKFQNFTTVAYLIILPVFYFLAPYIIKIFSGEPYKEVVLVFRILLIAVFFYKFECFQSTISACIR